MNEQKPGIEWRDIPGYERLYQVSNDGQVKRVGKAAGAKIGRILKPSRNMNGRGYWFVVLCRNGVTKLRPIHQIVAETFLRPVDNGMEINHRDGNKLNNSVSNLEYVSHSANMQHAAKIGLSIYGRGEQSRTGRLTDSEIRHARQLFHDNPEMKVNEVAELLGVATAYASILLSGRMRAEAGGPFKTDDRRFRRSK